MKLAALFSGGKDSTYAIYLAKKQGHEVVCLISLESERDDSYMFHIPNIRLTEKQAEAMELPIIYQKSSGIKEEELEDIKDALILAKEQYQTEGVVSGAVASNYQKERIDKICKDLKLKSMAPLWNIDAETYMKELIKNNFRSIIVGIAAEGFNKSWLGRDIDDTCLNDLRMLNKKYGVSICGEGGEYESFMYDCSLFKERIMIIEAAKVMENKNTGKLVIKKTELVNK
ncbi:diphthine--ammonia ligase [Candidatus Woesearchaeota archaeon]|nr:diphthine--ammonia ligase [Candidatus Woesearchaeota archaeon]